MLIKRYRLISALSLLLCSTNAALAYDYTIKLENGSNPDCNISTISGSRIVIDKKIVELSQFEHEDGVYTYQWSESHARIVAIQVELVDFKVPNVWGDPQGCVYSPTFDSSHTTFTQQYLEPDSKMPYTCTCTSSWEE